MIWEYAKESYKIDPLCFYIELLAMVLAVIGSIMLAYTAANPPMAYIYPWFGASALISVWTSYRRNSLLGIITCLYFFGADVVGFFIAIK